MSDFKTELGKRISEHRIKKGLTQSELGKQINVSRTVIAKLELGIQACSAEYVLSLSDVLEVSTDYLLRGVNAQTASISETTGLSQRAIDNLKFLHVIETTAWEQMPNDGFACHILENDRFLHNASDVHLAVTNARNTTSKVLIENSHDVMTTKDYVDFILNRVEREFGVMVRSYFNRVLNATHKINRASKKD